MKKSLAAKDGIYFFADDFLQLTVAGPAPMTSQVDRQAAAEHAAFWVLKHLRPRTNLQSLRSPW